MANGTTDQLFRQLTEQQQRQSRKRGLSQQLGGVSNAIVDFFVQKEQRADEDRQNKLKRTQRLEDLTDEFELKDRLSILKNRRLIDREATQNRREDLRNLELDVRRKKEFQQKREQEQIVKTEKQTAAEKAKPTTVLSLRTQFRQESKTFTDTTEAFQRILSSAKEPSAAGDLALIFNFMKVLDPGSVVRESEFKNAEQSDAFFSKQGVPNFIIRARGKAIAGKRLTDTQRNDFVGRARELFGGQQQLQNQRIANFSRLAQSLNVDPSLVISQFEIDKQLQPGGLPTLGQPQQSAPPLTPAQQVELENLRRQNREP